MSLGIRPIAAAIALSSSLLLAAGCGNDSPAGTTDAPPTVVDAPPGATFKISWGPLTVPKGQEDTRCVTVNVKNADAIKVHSITNKLSNGSHHLIVYRDNSATAENLTPTPCQPFAGALKGAATGVTPIMVTQKKDDSLSLPEGVAYTFKANQFMRLEMHFINTTDADLAISATSEFVTMPAAAVQNEADFLFMGTPDINLPAGATQTVHRFLPMPSALSQANIFAVTGHTHKYGTDMQVGYGPAAGPMLPAYKPAVFNWDEPETKIASPAFKLPAGGGFDFECTYHNTGTTNVKFGESANDEMCFFWAYYYPSVGPRVCAVTTQLGSNPFTLCCPDPSQQALCDRLLGP